MLRKVWFGYLLLLWVAIVDTADVSGYSFPIIHRKFSWSPSSHVIASVRECENLNGDDKVPLTGSFFSRALAASFYPNKCSSHTRSKSLSFHGRKFAKHPAKFTTPMPLSRKGKSKAVSPIPGGSPFPPLYRLKALLPLSEISSPPAIFAASSPAELSAPSPSFFNSLDLNSPPPISPHISGCCKENMKVRPDSHNCSCVYPITVALRIFNVSTSSTTWAGNLTQEFASQFNLNTDQCAVTSFYIEKSNQLNVTLDIYPSTSTSFSPEDARKINDTLVSHTLQLDSSIFGGYEVLNFTWVEPPALPPVPAPAPVVPSEGPSTIFSPPTNTPHKKKKSLKLTVVLSIIASSIVAVIMFGMFIFWKIFCNQDKKPDKFIKGAVNNARSVSSERSTLHPRSTRFFSFEELKEATNDFDSECVLGEGGFGRVYKGELKDGTLVAIKKLTSGGHQGDKEFLVEVDMLSRLHHRNLVKLVGYYSSRDASQQLLCYELVPNGSLEAWLHGPLGENHPLEWHIRMKIALDSARGLAYLHEDSQPCVIHRDFKASNILLENNFHAKVADFGLAKQAPEGRGNYLSTRVMGTFGYVAPEYAMTGHLLVKSDVYSYGVVLLELLTGRKPVDMSRLAGQENLVTWARPILRDKDRLDDLADPRLEGKYPREDFLQVCAIAAACVAPEASQRPTMGEVVQSLKMVQRTSEYHQSGDKDALTETLTSSSQPPTASGHVGPSSTTFESDGSSTFFSSGPYSGLSGIDNDNIPRTGVFSEDLHEGR